MGECVVVGIHHVKFPVSDLARSLAWYESVLGLQVHMEFKDEAGTLRGVAGALPGLVGTFVALRENAQAARGFSGFDPVALAVADRDAVTAWAARFDDLGISHSGVVEGSIGWLVGTHDPDGIEIRLYTASRDSAG